MLASYSQACLTRQADGARTSPSSRVSTRFFWGGKAMFPAAFDYRAPSSLDEALSILKQHGDEAKVMAGGQSLIPLLKLRFSRPELVVDIGRLPSMNNVMRRGGYSAIGALVRH